ncbi:MAG TPA: lipid-binding SYLF domain-containing protein [Steroidobacteraceae bacterium]|jgi:lipid-binding SYLF domain-containing protein|nr:lipid-binding SYLF domain-containing protein [Steroidobacteraceae bacterium]
MRIHTSVLLLAGIALTGAASAVHAQAREEGRLLVAGQVLDELRGGRDEVIPDRLLERAYGIAVIPDLTKVAFFAGGRRGHGVLVVRDRQGRFTSPVFITMTGGSFGWQWGVQSADIVLVFTTPKGVEGISGGKVTLGADASVAAGPVGRQASAATDPTFKAEVYSYSRSRGVFAGLALDGTVISIDDDADAAFYGKPGIAAGDLLSGSITSSDDAARRFMTAVASSTGTQRSASAAGSATSPAPAGAAAPASPAAPATAAQSFPLADPKPGSEPK